MFKKEKDFKDTTYDINEYKTATKNSHSGLVFILVTSVVSFILVQIITQFVGFTVISGNSMYPTYKDGQFLMYSPDTDNISYGDVILFKNEETNNRIYIKRVVALPGDNFIIDGLDYYCNGELLNESYTDTYSTAYYEDVTVPAQCVYVLGDNRDNSVDSREIGVINVNDIIGVLKN